MSKASMDRLLNVLVGDTFVTHGIASVKESFKAEVWSEAARVLARQSNQTCNLRCEGCYADSGAAKEKLEWRIIDRIVKEARELWGAPFIVISGGEPLVYRDEGKTVLDLAERHPQSYFMMYTNATLIDDEWPAG